METVVNTKNKIWFSRTATKELAGTRSDKAFDAFCQEFDLYPRFYVKTGLKRHGERYSRYDIEKALAKAFKRENFTVQDRINEMEMEEIKQ